jgi:hypothetical protein
VPHPSTPAAWLYTETQGIGKHNQGRPEPVALEFHAKNPTHFALSTKKTKGKQRPPIQVYCTIDKDHYIKHHIKIKNTRNNNPPARQELLSQTGKYHRRYSSVFLLFQGDQGIQRPYSHTQRASTHPSPLKNRAETSNGLAIRPLGKDYY